MEELLDCWASNKKTLNRLSAWCLELMTLPAAKNEATKKRLEEISASLRVKASTINRKSKIEGNLLIICDYLKSLQCELAIDGNASDVECYLAVLESAVDNLAIIIEHDVKNSLVEHNLSKPVLKFIKKKATVEAIVAATERSYSLAQKKLEYLRHSTPQTERERQRIEQRIRNLKSIANGRRSAADTLLYVVDILDNLEDTARLSPEVSKKINRVINLKSLADIYDNTEQSKKELTTLCERLFIIYKNQEGFNEYAHDMQQALARLMGGESSEPIGEPQAERVNGGTTSKKYVVKQAQTKSHKKNN